MPYSMPDHVAQDLKRLKENGGTRISRIRAIVKQALSATFAEVRDGSGEVREIVKESMSTTFDTTAAPSDAVQQTIFDIQMLGDDERPSDVVVVIEVDDQNKTPESTRSLFDQFFTWFRTQQSGSLQEQYQSFKVRLEGWDHQLAERYGDRYQTVKNQANNAKVWYVETKAKVDAGEESPGDRFQRQLDTNAQVVGTSAAQTEAAVKQHVLNWWKARQSS